MELTATERRTTSHLHIGFGSAIALLTGVRVASIGAGFVTSVIGARLIGASGLGVVGAAVTLATIGALVANGGLTIATIYLLGQRPHDARRIVGWVLALGLASAVLAAVVVLATGALAAERVLGTPTADLLMVTATLGAGIGAFELAGGVLLGLHERVAYVSIQIVEAVVSLVLTAVILVAFSRTASGYLAAAAAGYWAGVALGGWRARPRVGGVRPVLSRAFAREALTIGIRGQAGNILQFLNLRLDLLLVPALLNLASAGIYVVAVRISEVVTQVSTSAAAFLFPHVASQPEPGATTTTARTVRLTILFVVCVGALLALLAEPILSIAFGPSFAQGAWTVRITLLAMVPLSLVRVLAGDLKGRGRPGLVSVAALVAVGATILFDITLIPAFGIAGAALASLLSYTISAITLLAAFRVVTGAALSALVPGRADLRIAVTYLMRYAARATAGSRP